MPSLWHDSSIDLFRDDPDLSRRLLRIAGVDLQADARLFPAPTVETDRTLSRRNPGISLDWEAPENWEAAVNWAVVNAFAEGILTLSPADAKKYYEYALGMSPTVVRIALEHLMSTKYREPFSKLGLTYYGQGRVEGREEGLVTGERGTVLMVLKARGLKVSDSQREIIESCTDLATLKAWAEAALTAETADEVFAAS